MQLLYLSIKFVCKSLRMEITSELKNLTLFWAATSIDILQMRNEQFDK